MKRYLNSDQDSSIILQHIVKPEILYGINYNSGDPIFYGDKYQPSSNLFRVDIVDDPSLIPEYQDSLIVYNTTNMPGAMEIINSKSLIRDLWKGDYILIEKLNAWYIMYCVAEKEMADRFVIVHFEDDYLYETFYKTFDDCIYEIGVIDEKLKEVVDANPVTEEEKEQSKIFWDEYEKKQLLHLEGIKPEIIQNFWSQVDATKEEYAIKLEDEKEKSRIYLEESLSLISSEFIEEKDFIKSKATLVYQSGLAKLEEKKKEILSKILESPGREITAENFKDGEAQKTVSGSENTGDGINIGKLLLLSGVGYVGYRFFKREEQ